MIGLMAGMNPRGACMNPASMRAISKHAYPSADPVNGALVEQRIPKGNARELSVHSS